MSCPLCFSRTFCKMIKNKLIQILHDIPKIWLYFTSFYKKERSFFVSFFIRELCFLLLVVIYLWNYK